MRRHRLAVFLSVLVLGFLFANAHAEAGVRIEISRASQTMIVAVDGIYRYTWPVSTGRPGYGTPAGVFHPEWMAARWFSRVYYNAPMPHAIFIDLQGHAIHGFFDVKHLGLPVSHGCIRLSPDHAATLFDLVKAQTMANTKVVIAGRTPGGDNGPVARSRLPMNETVSASQPMQIAPDGSQQVAPSYGQPAYSQQPAPAYGQPAYGRPVYAQRPFPPQPQPYYGQGYYGQYQQPYYGQPVYRQW